MSTFRTSRQTDLHLRRTYLALSMFICACIFLLISSPASAQDWFRTGTGLGVSKARVAIADFVGKSPNAPPMGVQFSEVVRADLDFSGILEMVSKSYYPLQAPGAPAEMDVKAWTDAPASTQLLAFGNLSVNGNSLEIQAWLNDVRNASLPPIIGKVYRGDASDAQVRLFAHQFADEIISKLSGGSAGNRQYADRICQQSKRQ